MILPKLITSPGMHVVQILPELNQGGVERGTVELNRELVKRGHRSTVISAGGSQSSQIKKDGGLHITLDVCSKNPLSFPFRIFVLRRTLQKLMRESKVESRKSKIESQQTEDRDQTSEVSDQISENPNPQSATSTHLPPATYHLPPLILHVRSRVPAWLAWFANKKLKIPFVTTVHGFNSVSRYSKIMTQGDAVICVSYPVKEYIQKNYGTPEEKIAVIHRGIEPLEFDPQKLDHAWMDSFKTQYRLDGKFIVTAVGRITELKDYETLIHAVANCTDKIPNICGLIVGGVRHDKQAYYQRLQKLVEELHVQERILFAASHGQMPEIYALSDILISCSKKPESFGRTLIEAMAMNTPVIATRHGGTLDIITDGENGFLFSPGDADELAKAICRQKGIHPTNVRKEILNRFTLEQMVEQTIRVYHRVTKTSVQFSS